MRSMGGHAVCALAVTIVLAASSAARAQISAAAPEIAIVSDYRFRGISASERSPALQGSIDIESDKGFVAGLWASTISDYHGSNIELDIYAGVHRKVEGFDITLSAYGFVYPGGQRVNTYDFEALVARDFSVGSSETLIALAPRQANASRTNLYVAETIIIPIWRNGPVARAHLGWEDGMFDSKLDWSLGISQSFDELQLSVAYIGTNFGGDNQAGANGRASLVGAIRIRF